MGWLSPVDFTEIPGGGMVDSCQFKIAPLANFVTPFESPWVTGHAAGRCWNPCGSGIAVLDGSLDRLHGVSTSQRGDKKICTDVVTNYLFNAQLHNF